jgi:hypothetical protein
MMRIMQTETADARADSQKPKRRAPRTAWPPGVSGNPDGRLSRARRIAATIDALEREIGKPLTESQRVLAEKVAQLRERARAAGASEKNANETRMLLADLGLTRTQPPPTAPAYVPLRERLAAEAAEVQATEQHQ